MIILFVMNDIDTLLSVLFGGGGVFGVYKLIRLGILKIKSYNEKRKMKLALIQTLNDEIGTLKKQTSDVAKVLDNFMVNFSPNGGNSIFDKIDRIDKNTSINQANSRQILSMIEAKERPIASFESDANGNCIWASNEYLKIVGKQLDDIIQNGWKNMIDQNDYVDVMKGWKDALLESRDFDMTYSIKTVDGPRKVHCIAKVLKDNNKKILAYSGAWYEVK